MLLIITSAFKPSASKWLINPVEKAVVYRSDSILNIVKKHAGDPDNNYYVADSLYEAVLEKIKGFDRMHLYNSSGKRLLLMPDDACGSPVLSSSFSTDLSWYKEIESDDLEQQLKMFVAISPVLQAFNKKYPTAILYWNRTMGQQNDDNVFAWERAFKEKFNNQINIIKVNTDVNRAWRDEKKEQYLALFDKVLIATSPNR